MLDESSSHEILGIELFMVLPLSSMATPAVIKPRNADWQQLVGYMTVSTELSHSTVLAKGLSKLC